MAVLYGLLAAFGWGLADFNATRLAREIGSVRAMIGTQIVGLVALLVACVWLQWQSPTQSTLWPVAPAQIWLWALGLGVLHWAGVMLLYRAFEIGQLSVVAPIASSYAVVTALLSLLSGQRTPALALVGAALLVGGVICVTCGQSDNEHAQLEATTTQPAQMKRTIWSRGVAQSVLSALLFGVLFWGVGFVTPQLGVLWPIMVLRAVTIVGGGAWLIWRVVPRFQSAPNATTRANWRELWRPLLGVAAFDVMAWLSFAQGARPQWTVVVTALGSLFGAVTVLLAWAILRERLSRVQWLGVTIIFAGVLLVSV